LRDEKGHIFAYQGFNIDVTEQKEAEKTLCESEDRFKALHNASFGGIFIHDKGLILECNKALSEMSGYEYDELIGMDGLLLISEKSRETVMSNILAGYEEPYEALGVRKNGQEYPMRLEARNIQYKGRQVRVVECRDITEQKQAEEEAKYSRDLIKLITDNMFDLVALTDLKGNFEFAGKSHLALGYDQDYLIGRNVLEFVHPEDQHRMARELKDFVQLKDDGRRAEYRYRCQDGSYLWFETLGKTVQQSDFHPEKLLFSTRDITSRKQKEEELRKSRQALDKQVRLLNGFLENAPDILSIKKPDLTVIRYNKAGYEFLGKSPEDVHGNRCYELLGRQTNCDNCASIDAIRTKKPVFREKYVSELDTYFSCRANPVISENGNVEYIVEIIRDITERKKNEEMQSIFSQMLQNSEHIAVFKDPSLKYVLINNAYTKLTGHTLPQVIGKTDKELFQGISTPEQIQEYIENDRKALELSPGRSITVEESSLDEKGETRTFITKKFPVHDEHRLLLGVGTITFDITDLKRAEREIMLINQQLEQVNAEKDKLFSIIAHDLKSPISGIYSTSQLLAQEAGSI
ncbi:PAS domain S-box protein, partial [Methanosalsum natronophilum]